MRQAAATSKPDTFAVYCRDGLYLQRIRPVNGYGPRMSFGPSPVPMGRTQAARACAAVRAVGVGSWLVAA